ncbi:hypothetical protein [Candidatus Synchoanobacter obligatus]|uniref:Tetratricopeptide repeat protein n=1 Tax=Candidatus Synchoanobacter obligatus TaxID=2919597 RepID=A0ABT1L5B1_9GAMM|nr:hypothetical protein [Candidatus Synchoanobacter obligatus]MCP8352367.1 hypothetical protein [Candidatus Synchoanobacter obligatus]
MSINIKEYLALQEADIVLEEVQNTLRMLIKNRPDSPNYVEALSLVQDVLRIEPHVDSAVALKEALMQSDACSKREEYEPV